MIQILPKFPKKIWLMFISIIGYSAVSGALIEKKNINKILFEEGSRIVTKRLDILAMFDHFYVIEIMQKKLGIEVKGMDMSDKCKNSIHIYDMYNNYNAIKN